MSSDSGESHSSAHHGQVDEIDIGTGEDVNFENQPSLRGEAAVGKFSGTAEDAQELQSIDGDEEGLTFARTRKSLPPQDEAETASEVSYIPKINRPASLESVSTPDDTPSIQVGTPTRPTRHQQLTSAGFRSLLTWKQRPRVA